MDVFVSVGTGLSPAQEAFVGAVEERLRAIGLNPRTIGRNTFSTEAPLHAVIELMDRCAGAVVIAIERYHFPVGVERRASPRERTLSDVLLPTSWNQIEAAMAYGRELPLFVLVDEELRCDGLLEKGNDWFVHELAVDPAALSSPSFLGLLDDWRERIERRQQTVPTKARASAVDPGGMTIGQLISSLRPAQLWACLVAAAGALAGAFALGLKLSG
jgi:hypothetical protein